MRKSVLLVLFLVCQIAALSQVRFPLRSTSSDGGTPKGYEEGDAESPNLDLNAISLLKSRYPDLQGKGIIICQKEHSPDPKDIDWAGRFLPSVLTSKKITPHATMVATLMVGAGNSSPLNTGVAPEANLLSVNFTQMLPESDDFYQRNQVSLVNHSYGTQIENFYGREAAAYDASMSRSPGLLHIFSAGNLGYTSSSDGIYANIPSVANLTGNFKMSKNSLVVGAINSRKLLLPSSSRGPAYDGRMKPELVAYSEEGTSGATALVSGVAALLQQLYQTQHNTVIPAALVRAVLINSAEDVGNKGIDFQSGYGSIHALKAAQTVSERRYLTGTVSQGGTFTASIPVPPSQAFQVTLVWTDEPAAVNSLKALVNDLDLTVSDKHTSWQPWVLNAFPHIDSLQKVALRGRDTLNTIEQVTIENPLSGEYTIHVKGAKIANGSQSFYIAYQWEKRNDFEWTAPNSKAHMLSDSVFTLLWHSTKPDTWGRLEFSADEGQTWALVSDSILLSQERLVWHCPSVLTKGRLKMSIAGEEYLTDVFMLSPLLKINVLFACADSIKFQWRLSNAAWKNWPVNLYQFDYQVNGWRKIRQLLDSSQVVKGADSNSLFSISLQTPDGESGLRSEIISGQHQQVFCYYKQLTAHRLHTSIEVACELSSSEDIRNVTFQKQTAQGWKDLETLAVFSLTSHYSTIDGFLQEGGNTYRVTIVLKTGTAIYSDVVTSIVAKERLFLVFPVPVEVGNNVRMMTEDGGNYQVRIFDRLGKSLGEYDFFSNEFEIPLLHVNSGIYFYEISQLNQSLQRGKFVVK